MLRVEESEVDCLGTLSVCWNSGTWSINPACGGSHTARLSALLQEQSMLRGNLPNPGNSPPSKAPKIIRQATRPPKLCVMPVKVATMPHAVVMNESHLEGVNFLITKLLGSSLAMYVTKSRDTAI